MQRQTLADRCDPVCFILPAAGQPVHSPRLGGVHYYHQCLFAGLDTRPVVP